MIFETGTYTGNGTSQTISLNEITAVPDFVMVKQDGSRFAKYRMPGMTDSQRTGHSNTSATGITALADGEFSVGADADANSDTIVYHYIAIYDDGNGDFAIGTATGDVSTTQVVDSGLSALEMVWVFEDAAANDRWHCLSMGGTTDASFGFAALATPATGYINDISTTAGSFVLGTNLNTSGNTYRWVAFAPTTSLIDSVSYTGTGGAHGEDVDPNNGGNTPEFVMIGNASTARYAVWRAEESGRGHSGDDTSRFEAILNLTGRMTAFSSETVTLGTNTDVNNSGDTYHLFWLVSNPNPAPYAESVTTSKTSSNATSTTVDYPATVDAGDLLLCLWANDGGGDLPTWPTGDWADNELYTVNVTFGVAASYIIAAGTEGGGSFTVTHPSETTIAQLFRILNWHGTTPPEMGTAVTFSTDDWEVLTLNPSWDSASDDTFWILFGCNDSLDTVLTWPTEFPDNRTEDDSGNAAGPALQYATDDALIGTKSQIEYTGAFDQNHGRQQMFVGIRGAVAGGGIDASIEFSSILDQNQSATAGALASIEFSSILDQNQSAIGSGDGVDASIEFSGILDQNQSATAGASASIEFSSILDQNQSSGDESTPAPINRLNLINYKHILSR